MAKISRTIGTAAIFAALVLIASASMWASSATAVAQEDDASKAKIYYERGARLYELGQYGEAAEYLRKAYVLIPRPMLLYNIAMAEWRGGEFDTALETAERALEKDLPGETRVQAQARVAAFRQILETRRLAKTFESRPAVAQTPTAVSPDAYESDDEPSFGGLGWAGVSIGAVGVGALVAALVVDRELADDSEQFELTAETGDREAYQSQLDDLENRQTIGRLLLVSGALLTATGATLFVLELTDDTDETKGVSSIEVGAGPTVGGAQASVRWIF